MSEKWEREGSLVFTLRDCVWMGLPSKENDIAIKVEAKDSVVAEEVAKKIEALLNRRPDPAEKAMTMIQEYVERSDFDDLDFGVAFKGVWELALREWKENKG